MTRKYQKFISILITVILILLLFKVDYRFKEIYPGGSQDDSSYYYHTQTLAVDFDLDYSNQLNGNFKDAFIRADGKPVPRQSFGPGLLNSPFLLLANTLSKQINIKSNTSMNYFIYSLIAAFYLYLSVLFLRFVIIDNKNYQNNKMLLFIFGSGITYFAFERFSMSTVYEFFSVCLIILISYKIKKDSTNNWYIFFLPVAQFLMLINRWNNLHLFLVPLIYLVLYRRNLNILFKNLFFYLGNIVGVFVFLIHTKLLYGFFTLSQTKIYPKGDWIVNQRLENFLDLSNFSENIFIAIKYLTVTCFSMEFGIFYFSAIIFAGFYFLGNYLLTKNYKLFALLSLFYLIPFLPILVFENHGTSYGFRYLFTLIPINLLIYFKEYSKHRFLTFYLIVFSLFGILSQLFFETTHLSSLSESTIQNSFGSDSPYSNPTYLKGILQSMLDPSAYLKIIFTSFIGVILVKTINLITDFELLLTNYYQVDGKLSNLLLSFDNYSWVYLVITILLIVSSTKILLSNSSD